MISKSFLKKMISKIVLFFKNDSEIVLVKNDSEIVLEKKSHAHCVMFAIKSMSMCND